jgi:hypothetical protein
MWSIIYFVILDSFKTIPEITIIADQIPANLFAIKVKSIKEIIVLFLHHL